MAGGIVASRRCTAGEGRRRTHQQGDHLPGRVEAIALEAGEVLVEGDGVRQRRGHRVPHLG